MAGIYIHIPFCRKACHYCNFHFSTSTDLLNNFVEALLIETELRQKYIGGNISTVYFGGGTPSILSADALNQIFGKLQSTFIIEQGAEITLEANPDDISVNKIMAWQQIGINRLSIGIQSSMKKTWSG
jgi:oxygen-independent coproporphyrinogen-3 oxidase